MKPITEQRRQELIEYIKAALAAHVQRGGDSDEEDVFKIALASLTAVPFAWIHPNMLDDMDGGRISGRVWNSPVDEMSGEERLPVYTAPPVPVIKFPNPQDIPDGYDLPSCMATAEWYQQEIKRLNGLGE